MLQREVSFSWRDGEWAFYALHNAIFQCQRFVGIYALWRAHLKDPELQSYIRTQTPLTFRSFPRNLTFRQLALDSGMS